MTQSHRRTTATMAAMRQTLHDEHSCLVQVPASSLSSCLIVKAAFVQDTKGLHPKDRFVRRHGLFGSPLRCVCACCGPAPMLIPCHKTKPLAVTRLTWCRNEGWCAPCIELSCAEGVHFAVCCAAEAGPAAGAGPVPAGAPVPVLLPGLPRRRRPRQVRRPAGAFPTHPHAFPAVSTHPIR